MHGFWKTRIGMDVSCVGSKGDGGEGGREDGYISFYYAKKKKKTAN